MSAFGERPVQTTLFGRKVMVYKPSLQPVEIHRWEFTNEVAWTSGRPGHVLRKRFVGMELRTVDWPPTPLYMRDHDAFLMSERDWLFIVNRTMLDDAKRALAGPLYGARPSMVILDEHLYDVRGA